VSVEEQVYFIAEILLEICIKAIPTDTRQYMYLCLISLLRYFLLFTPFSLMDMLIGVSKNGRICKWKWRVTGELGVGN
jgi:hypothetical protein